VEGADRVLRERHPFDYRVIDDEHPDNIAEWQRRWPMQLFPLLVDGDAQIFEATSIIEYLEANHPGPVRLIPANAKAAVTVRWLDRVFDNYVMKRMALSRELKASGSRANSGPKLTRPWPPPT